MLFPKAWTCVEINQNKGLGGLCKGNFTMMKNKLEKQPDGEIPSYALESEGFISQ